MSAVLNADGAPDAIRTSKFFASDATSSRICGASYLTWIMTAVCPFPSPWPSAPNVRFFANAAQVRRLGLIAAFARRSASQSSVLARAVGDAKAVDEHV